MRSWLSSRLWWDVQETGAAYQFIGAPSFANSLYNRGRLRGIYTCTSSAYPTWDSTRGASFNGSSTYLNTSFLPDEDASTLLIRFSDWGAAATWQIIAGTITFSPTEHGILIQATSGGASGGGYYSRNGTAAYVGTLVTSGVVGVSGSSAYRNGAYLGALTAGGYEAGTTIGLGCANGNVSQYRFANATIQAALLVRRTLSPEEVALYSHQMLYCEFNPAWNAWAPKRRYYYRASTAPTSAARPLVNGGLVDNGLVNGGLVR